MSFQDIFTNNFLESASTLSVYDMGLTLLLSFVLGLFIYQVYKKSYQSVVYTKSFSVSLVMMTMITSLVIMAVTANVVLSLGMVGALSIVRFRAAIKDPMDIVFMFWAIAAGIVTGAGFFLLGLAGSLIIGVVIILMNINVSKDKPYLLMLNLNDATSEALAIDKLTSSVGKCQVKSKTVGRDSIELLIDVRIKNDDTSIVNELSVLKGVSQAMLVSSSEYSL